MTTYYKNDNLSVISADTNRLLETFNSVSFWKNCVELYQKNVALVYIFKTFVSYKGEYYNFKSITFYHGNNSTRLSIVLDDGQTVDLLFECKV